MTGAPFQTQARMSRGIFLPLFFIMVPSLGLSVWAVSNAFPDWGVGLYALVIVILLVPLFAMKVKLHVDDQAVTFSTLGMFRETIPLNRISSVEPGPETGFKEGAGLRMLGNATGYLVGGPSIAIQSGPARYLVSVPDPQAATDAINRRLQA